MGRFNNGWVKIHRKAILGDIYSNFTRGGLFTTLVGIANMQESSVSWRGKPKKLERGELVTSLVELSSLGEADRKTVEKHLNYLALRGTIAVEKSPQGVLIKIQNFDFYQSVDADGGKRGRTSMDDDMDNGMDNAMDDGVPHIEETKKLRKKKERNKKSVFDFEKAQAVFKFQTLGPNAQKRFDEQMKTQSDFDDLMASLTHYKAMLALSENEWRRAKVSFETFLGTAKAPFWRQYISPDSCKPTKHSKRAAGALTRDTNADDEFQSIMSEVMGNAAS